jgi:hypothetical protein
MAHNSPSLTYADIGPDGTLQRKRGGPESPRRMGSVTGSFTDSVSFLCTTFFIIWNLAPKLQHTG